VKRKREWNRRLREAWESEFRPITFSAVGAIGTSQYARAVCEVLLILARRVSRRRLIDQWVDVYAAALKMIDGQRIEGPWCWHDLWALIETAALTMPSRFGPTTMRTSSGQRYIWIDNFPVRWPPG
jgi:hypothetical protein